MERALIGPMISTNRPYHFKGASTNQNVFVVQWMFRGRGSGVDVRIEFRIGTTANVRIVEGPRSRGGDWHVSPQLFLEL